METKASKCESDSPAPALRNEGNGCAVGTDFEKQTIKECPVCQGELRFGSRDLAEGDYWWCKSCGYGPIRFPLFCGPPVKQITNVGELLGIIDADKSNEALRIVAALKQRATHNAITSIQRAHGLGRGL